MLQLSLNSLVVSGLLLAASASFAQELNVPENTTVRDYPKRDRLLIGSSKALTPSQLHESYGLRVKISEEYQQTISERDGNEVEINTPQTSADISYGWQSLTVGLGLKYSDAEVDADTALSEDYINRKTVAQLAYTFGENWTLGSSLEHNWLDVRQSSVATSDSFEYEFSRLTVGLSYHTEKLEFGISRTGAAAASSVLEAGTRGDSLSLAELGRADRRDIYLPTMTTVFGRGNLTQNFSLLSSVTVAEYDDNMRGAVSAFDDANTEDLISARVSGVYWTDSHSHITLAAEYKGGAVATGFEEESLLGYRFANTLGASLEGVFAIDRRIYLGARVAYLQGENDITDETGTEVAIDEQSTRVGGFIGVKI